MVNKNHPSDLIKSCFCERKYLFNFVGHIESVIQDKGITLEMVFTGDLVTNNSGGLKTHSDIDTSISYLTNTDLMVELDTKQTDPWKGGSFFAHIFNHHGAIPSKGRIGDLQAVDNIESEKVTKLYEVWYEHTLELDGTELSMLIGQHDLNSEFNVTEYGSLFLNSSFGFNNKISNDIPVSNFPVAALGFRIKWKPTENLYFMAEISDGVPGKNNGRFDWKLNTNEGGAL